jgi:hypothetical protein
LTDIEALLRTFEEELAGIIHDQEKLARKRSALEQTIGGMQTLLSLNGDRAPVVEPKIFIAKDAFVGLTITEAAIAYLHLIGKPQTNREVADALVRGGIASTASDFASTVRSILLRDHERPDGSLRWDVPNWELREWNLGKAPLLPTPQEAS